MRLKIHTADSNNVCNRHPHEQNLTETNCSKRYVLMMVLTYLQMLWRQKALKRVATKYCDNIRQAASFDVWDFTKCRLDTAVLPDPWVSPQISYSRCLPVGWAYPPHSSPSSRHHTGGISRRDGGGDRGRVERSRSPISGSLPDGVDSLARSSTFLELHK